MTELALEHIKLIMLFMLIGSLIGLSHLNAKRLADLKAALNGRIQRRIGALPKPAAHAN